MSPVGEAYDAVAVEYATHFGAVSDIHAADRAFVQRWLGDTDGSVLDAGCGPGQWTALLGAGGAAAMGLDLSGQLLAHARRTGPRLEPFDHRVALAWTWPAGLLAERAGAAGFDVVGHDARDGRRPHGALVLRRWPPVGSARRDVDGVVRDHGDDAPETG